MQADIFHWYVFAYLTQFTKSLRWKKLVVVQWHHNATVRKCDLEKLLKERFVSSYSYTKTNISYHAWRNWRLAMDCFHVSKCQKKGMSTFSLHYQCWTTSKCIAQWPVKNCSLRWSHVLINTKPLLKTQKCVFKIILKMAQWWLSAEKPLKWNNKVR